MSSEPQSDKSRHGQPVALDPVASVRGHPNWFFATGRFEWQTAVGLLVAEALHSPLVRSTEVHHHDDWVAVSADADWLDGDLEGFTKPTAFPEGGTNATRVEVLLTAFCDAVFTATGGSRSDIHAVGEGAMPPSMADALANPRFGRIIVFRIPEPGYRTVQAAVPRTTERIANALAAFPDLERRFQDA